jgi:hypothetical protein
MDPLESVQQSRPGQSKRPIFPGPRRPGALEATNCRRLGQRFAVLSSAVQHLLGPQLSEPQPLVHSANAVQERCANS